ncbi:MAG: lipid II flippase MurJ [Candidatus Paceibacterota bacterium]|jgi:putative peptidoglycan lipid II flippase
MVSRLTRFLQKEFNGLHQAAFLLAGATLLSQLLGLLRDRLLASSFGASGHLDVYYAAFRIPDLIYVSVASFVSATVLIPLIIQKIDDEKQELNRFLNSIISAFMLVMIVVTGLLFIFMPRLVFLVAPGFDAESTKTLILLSRMMLLSPLLLGLSNLFGSVVQAYRQFFAFALSPLFYNLGIIVGILWLYPLFGIAGLAMGVVLGAVCHLAIQLPPIWKTGLKPKLARINWSEVWQVVSISLPRTLTLSANQIALAALVAMASLLSKGSISVFNFAYNLQSVPLAIVGVSYSVAAFPVLAGYFSAGKIKEFTGHIVSASRHIIFWALPATIFFIVLRAQIVRIILGAGQFDWSATRLTAACLALFVISVVAQSLVLLLVRGYYAAGRTRVPLVLNITSSLLVIVFAFGLREAFANWPFFKYFIESLLRVSDVAGAEVLILPLAFSLGMIFNLITLAIFFERHFGDWLAGVSNTFFQSFSGSVIGGAVAYVVLDLLGRYWDLNHFWSVLGQGAIAGLAGVLVWLAILILLKSEELVELSKSLLAKTWKAQPIAPEAEGL